MSPLRSTLDDVPAWLRPTHTQDTTPHPAVIDLVPWPRLRDYFCLNHEKDTRQFTLLASSLRLLWPASKQIISKSPNGHFRANSELQNIACDIQYWQIDDLWLDAYPELAKSFVFSASG